MTSKGMRHFAWLSDCHGSGHDRAAMIVSLQEGARVLAVGMHAYHTINLLLFFAFWHSVGRQEPVQ